MTGISFEVIDGIQTADPLMRREPQALQAAQEMYQAKKTGPFCIGGIGSHAYLPVLDFTSPNRKQQQADLLAKIPASSTTDGDTDAAYERGSETSG